MIGVGKQQRNHLGHVADRMVALIEKPFGDVGPFACPLPQTFRWHCLWQFAARQKVDGPCCIFGSCLLKVGGEH